MMMIKIVCFKAVDKSQMKGIKKIINTYLFFITIIFNWFEKTTLL